MSVSVADRVSGGGGPRVRDLRGCDQILNRYDVKGGRLISVRSFGFDLSWWRSHGIEVKLQIHMEQD